MSENDTWGATLGRSESLLDSPTREWGSIMSQRPKDKVDPIGELNKFASEASKRNDQKNAEEKKAWGKQREEGLKFSDPVKSEAGMPPILKGKFPRVEDPAKSGETGVDHDWKIIASGTAEAPTWTVAQGLVYYLNDSTVATVGNTTVEGEQGGVYLHIVRDASSRAATAQTVEFYADAPATTETDQYFLLGNVGGTPSISQKQFTPVRVFEDLFVVNGEFKLGSIAMLADNLYTPPV